MPDQIELKLGIPIKVLDLVLMLLAIYPGLSATIPKSRTEANLKKVLKVINGDVEVPLSSSVSDATGDIHLTLSLRNEEGGEH